MEENNKDGFNYTYSAKEQTEIKKIREKYTQKADGEEDKMTRLRRLDATATKRAQSSAITLGIIGALILGFGMSLIMSDLSSALGMSEFEAIICGVAIGVLGAIPVCLAYPIYNLILKRERKKVAPEIIRLTDELMK